MMAITSALSALSRAFEADEEPDGDEIGAGEVQERSILAQAPRPSGNTS